MIIYQITHLPTNKVYIGALKNDSRWPTYNTSSKIVSPMMKAQPDEWKKEILLQGFADYVTWSDVVALEQTIIRATAMTVGWKNMWNRGAYNGQVKLAMVGGWPKGKSRGPYGGMYGKKHDQKVKDAVSVANKGKKAWNKGAEYSDTTKNKIKSARALQTNIGHDKRVFVCEYCNRSIKSASNLLQHIRAKHQ